MSDELDALIERLGPARVCEALAPYLSAERIARIDAVLDARLVSVSVAVEDVYDPHNAAAAIRSCEGLGLQDFHIVEGEHRFAAASGVTQGSDDWIDLHRWPTVAAAVEAWHAGGFRVYAAVPGAMLGVDELDVRTPIALVFGNEHAGLSAAAIAACDGGFALPMFGFSQSYNLSVSVALGVSRIAHHRRGLLDRAGDLPAERRAYLRARWFANKIRGAVGLVERAVSG